MVHVFNADYHLLSILFVDNFYLYTYFIRTMYIQYIFAQVYPVKKVKKDLF